MQGDHEGAESTGMDAINAGFCDVWTVHAVAHAMFFQGRPRECLQWLETHDEVIKECGPFMRIHIAFHKALCFVDLEDANGLEMMLQGDLWASLSPEEKNDYWTAVSVLNILWKADLRGVKVSFDYASQALQCLEDFSPKKSKVTPSAHIKK